MVAKLNEPLERVGSSDGTLMASAISKAAAFWDLTNDSLGATLGLSAATVSRLRNGQWQFERGTKPFELAQLLLRLFRSLDSMTGSDDLSSRSWLTANNTELDGRPIDLIRSIQGLMSVTDYVDAYRAKV
jgi:uncharacterized protein (DUF2384 family)